MDTDQQQLEHPRNRTFIALLGDLKEDCANLFRQEAKLAKLEVKENVTKTGKLTAITAAGALVGFAGLIVLLIGIGSLVSLAFGGQTGAIAAGQCIIGLLTITAGSLTAYIASQRLPKQPLIPDQAISSLKASASQIKNELT